MRKVFFFLLFAIVLFPMHAQRRVQRDTVRIGGLPMGVTITIILKHLSLTIMA